MEQACVSLDKLGSLFVEAVETEWVLLKVIEKKGCGSVPPRVGTRVLVDQKRGTPEAIDDFDAPAKFLGLGIDLELVQKNGLGLPVGLSQQERCEGSTLKDFRIWQTCEIEYRR